MLEANLSLHDPVDIYDYLKSKYGTLQMHIKKNKVLIRFQNPKFFKQILQNPTKMIKSFTITFKIYEGDQQNKRKNMGILNSDGNFTSHDQKENLGNTIIQPIFLGGFIELPDLSNKLKGLGTQYDAKINQIKQIYQDSEVCNNKITQFNNFITKNIKNTRTKFFEPYQNLINRIKNYSNNGENNPMEIQPDFSAGSNYRMNNQLLLDVPRKTLFSPLPNFKQGICYSSNQAAEAKRICKLNDNDFICSLKNDRNSNAGQLRIYRKNNVSSIYDVKIDQGPYSLLVYENYILAGDYNGQIHFLDFQYENMCVFSNRIVQGLLVQMEHFQFNRYTPSILTLSSGTRSDYKIKMFQIQKEKLNDDVASLSFSPGEQMLCEGITMSIEVLDVGKFAYGCGRNTYICPSFNKSDRQYVTHDENVMKIKKRNQIQLIEATQRKILLTDLRSIKVKNEIYDFQYQLNNIQLFSDHYVFYGGQMGQVGMIDIRKPKCHIWSPSQQIHMGKISGILKMNDRVITCDNKGVICEWKNQ